MVMTSPVPVIPDNAISVRRTGIRLLVVLLLAACGGGGGGGSGSAPAVLTSIAMSPATPTLTVGTNVQLRATGNYSDGTTRVLSGVASWMSSATQVATVDTGGNVSAIASGSATIGATYSGLTASTTVTVTPTPLQVTVTYLHRFQADPLDGGQPNGPLLQASDGNFYGTTRAGGIYQCRVPDTIPCGTVFKLTPSGAETVLYSFGTSATDGYVPGAPLIQANDGALYGTTTNGGANGGGTVFKITLDGVYTSLYSFGASPTDGIVPFGALIQASDGNFYGTTASGGANVCASIPQSGTNCGTVFRMTPAGVETVLYSFGASPTDAVGPVGSLLQASDGNFYGAAGGGANGCSTSIPPATNNCGTVFMITPTGVETVLHSFGSPRPTDGIAPNGSLIQGSDGDIYGTTSSGGGGNCGSPFACGTVFRMTTAGAVTILYAFSMTSKPDGNFPLPSLIQASDGNFYGATGSGGDLATDSDGTVFRLTPTGEMTILYSFGPLNTNPSRPIGGLIQASDGAFYGVTEYGGQGNGSGTAFKLVVQ